MAADLGGDCCADLEERVAELEATTARKGNRKVSLTISGQVNELVYWWDNGDESNVYQGTSGFSSSRFRFKGDANINSDWSAGYMIEIEVKSAQVNRNTADNDDGPDSGNRIDLRHSYWYLKSKRLGKLSIGHTSFAADDILSSTGLGGTASASQGNFDGSPGMGLNFGGTIINNVDVFDVWDVDRGNVIRYDSPSIVGFVLSAAWGEDDRWDVALRYAGEFNGIKLAAAIGYHEFRENVGSGAKYSANGEAIDFDDIRGAISVLHVPTGLFADFGITQRDFDHSERDDFTFWYIRGGVYRKFNALGKTSIFGEYGEVSDSGDNLFYNADGTRAVIADGTFYGIGVQQQIDAAAMELYLGWRHFEADAYEIGVGSINTDDIDTVYTGAR
ncbi:MAG: porin, partial [Planctomycetaceae bacterium]